MNCFNLLIVAVLSVAEPISLGEGGLISAFEKLNFVRFPFFSNLAEQLKKEKWNTF